MCDQNSQRGKGDDGGNGADSLDEICALRVPSNRTTCGLTIESHNVIFKVKEGNVLFEYQPFATKEPKVFDDDICGRICSEFDGRSYAEEFVPNRFVGDSNKLLKFPVLCTATAYQVAKQLYSSFVVCCCCRRPQTKLQ
ncbi:unnamed protein product [Lactuca saligna]|uniref:Uncharacterized protein n=1 Tax=Lactuca saligna TaxID=75948 RepID=A0AA35Z6S6_LACSI|nr:unnamed protein product [Lactuca saligna]